MPRSRLMFGWVSPIISLAHRRGGLGIDDFPETPTYDMASPTTEALMLNFARVHRPESSRTRGLSLAYAVALTFGWSWLACLVVFLTEAAMELVEVYTMGNIILFLQVLHRRSCVYYMFVIMFADSVQQHDDQRHL